MKCLKEAFRHYSIVIVKYHPGEETYVASLML
jgi:hypothetical protein